MKKLVLFLPVLLVVGCTSTSTFNAALHQDWEGLAERDVSLQLPQRSESSLSELGAIDPAVQALYISAYQVSKDAFCDPARAFKMGFMGERYDGFCDDRKDGWIFYQNWNIGRGASQMDRFPL
ncbi:DUF2799 domain-containing protein [Grimontia hollisae]|uniref:Protein of uncharacterized function (DUF2799) n=1 Tax=Grimontia hollisae TaxID=673 RepID=A0A377HK51_GRIHO|nr:DUF2799 domain-containing protein [Grimontia hollisae]AMG30055.2 DUF2799 domain-containing protein [Grimontia hollisae]MDF2183628.1 DUF2799 domain-containing protein [Grimontia hollisae]STO42771.1 Protein of uncharacterised function (DUF2799) [Grimontia hollisae]STO56590.1 Protein of uncharacterised function (DUF2799) [Grimontia hollisae]